MRALARVTPGERLVTHHAAEQYAQLEVALTMLGVAVDILAAVSGKYRDQVVDALELAAEIEMSA